MGMATPVMTTMGPEKSNLERLYEATPYVVMPEPLSESEYRGIKFWEEVEWEKWCKEGKEKGIFKIGVPGEGINSSWMEDKNGNRIDCARQGKLLREARRTWITMRGFEVNITVYMNTPAPTLDYFRARMEGMFFELRLCADHWKADRVWKENFSSWEQPRSTNKPQEAPQLGCSPREVSGF